VPDPSIGRIPGSLSILQIDYDETIQSVDELIIPPEIAEYIAPGFIDLQVNGFAGADFNDPRTAHETLAAAIGAMFQTGVTRFYPTIITGSEQRITGALRNLVAAKRKWTDEGRPEGAAMEAFHIEGPHLSPENGPRGAHPLEHIRPPDIQEFERWQAAADGGIRLITVSPEWEQTPEYVRHVTRCGVVASIGHTKANGEQIAAAVEAGATMSTHLGNAAHSTLHKTQNYIWEQLAEDRLMASFIVDGIHLPPPFVRAAMRAKGIERSVLVTDAVMPATCAPGPYRLGDLEVELRADGSVVLQAEERLAGSALRMDHAIQNSVNFAKLSLPQALAMATSNAARAGRIAGRQRGLSVGEKADLVRFRWNETDRKLEVIETIVAGKTVYNA
jgi:N-acetylglucosamine-6-phosphate deacetylase